MRMRHSDLHTYTLDDWVDAFHDVYGETNKSRAPQAILSHIVEHASQMQEDFRTGRWHDALNHLADAFCWTCALVRKCSSLGYTIFSMEETWPRTAHLREYCIQNGFQFDSYSFLILWKFPSVCHHCATERCICVTRSGEYIDDATEKQKLEQENADTIDEQRHSIEDKLATPQRLGDIEDMLVRMYRHLNVREALQYTMAHFQEEVGEVAECLSNIDERAEAAEEIRAKLQGEWKQNLRLELPDILVWTVGLVWKFDRELGIARIYRKMVEESSLERRDEIRKEKLTEGLGLAEVLWNRYGGGRSRHSTGLHCPRCGLGTCDPTRDKRIGQT